MRGRFGKHRRELMAAVALVLAASGLLVLIAANPGGNQTFSASTPFSEVAPDLDALHAARSMAVTEIAVTEHHIGHFEWGIGNLLRNISLLDYRADILSGEIQTRRRANQAADDQRRSLAEIDAIRLDYMGEIERAEQAIAGLKGEIAVHRETIDRIDRTLGGMQTN